MLSPADDRANMQNRRSWLARPNYLLHLAHLPALRAAVGRGAEVVAAAGTAAAAVARAPAKPQTSPQGGDDTRVAFHLESTVLLDRSCGKHSYNNAPPNAEYFLDTPATWTITATAENGSGLTTTGTFIIKVQ
jgi:hypothetical protein